MLQLFNYNAGAGDCIRIRFDSHNVIIDTGTTHFGPRFAAICNEIKASGEEIDALVLTHADSDHIGGILYGLRLSMKMPIRQVWMNHGRPVPGNIDLSARQNDEVYSLLLKQNIPVAPAVAGSERKIGEAAFRILSPGQELSSQFYRTAQSTPLKTASDYAWSIEELMDRTIQSRDISQSNRASIVLELSYGGRKLLFTGDAWADDITEAAAAVYDLIKLPHHGSVRNISEKWKDIKCSHYMVCTDGLGHPDKQTIAKLIRWNGSPRFYCTAPWWKRMLLSDDRKYEGMFIEGEKIPWQIPV